MSALGASAGGCSAVKPARRRAVWATVAVCAGVIASGWCSPATAMADPSEPSCPLALVLMCKMLPIAPDLEGDIDLTQPAAQSAGSQRHRHRSASRSPRRQTRTPPEVLKQWPNRVRRLGKTIRGRIARGYWYSG